MPRIAPTGGQGTTGASRATATTPDAHRPAQGLWRAETAEAARLTAEWERDALRACLEAAQAAPQAPGAAGGPAPTVAGVVPPTSPLTRQAGEEAADTHPAPRALWQRLRQALRGG